MINIKDIEIKSLDFNYGAQGNGVYVNVLTEAEKKVLGFIKVKTRNKVWRILSKMEFLSLIEQSDEADGLLEISDSFNGKILNQTLSLRKGFIKNSIISTESFTKFERIHFLIRKDGVQKIISITPAYYDELVELKRVIDEARVLTEATGGSGVASAGIAGRKPRL